MISGRIFFDRIISQVEFGFLFFIEEYLHRYAADDIAGIRCLQMLISFHFELLLKSRYVLVNSFTDEKDVDGKLEDLGHDIKKIGDKLGSGELAKIGIKNIFIDGQNRYNIETDEGRIICIENFTNIRYDFISGYVRKLSREEDLRVKEDMASIKKIIEKVKIN